jgi:alanine racemase
MSSPRSTARLTVDLDALANNYRLLDRTAGSAEVAPVVKADGYGLGALEAAQRLRKEGARRFFTARLGGGEALRARLGPEPVIYVLDGCTNAEAARRLRAADLVPALSSLEQIEIYRAEASGGGRLKAVLHVDTGMNRLGLRPEQAADLAARPGALAGLELDLVMSHLACASEPAHPMNARQLAAFREVRALFPDVRASLANSGGTFLGPDYAFDLVRPGIVLYGGGPEERPDPRVQPVATLEAEILQVRTAEPGETVGYGASYTAPDRRTLAVIGIGYADGVLRAHFDRRAVWFDGALRPFAGRVSMDLTTIDVTGSAAARPGALVELFGRHRLVDDAAADAGTLAYELLTRVGPRVDRFWRSGG